MPIRTEGCSYNKKQAVSPIQLNVTKESVNKFEKDLLELPGKIGSSFVTWAVIPIILTFWAISMVIDYQDFKRRDGERQKKEAVLSWKVLSNQSIDEIVELR